MDKTDSKPVSEEELKEESDIVSIEEKDGSGYGDLQSLNAQPDETNSDGETYVGRRAPPIEEIKRSETYIQERKSYSMGMTDQNKLKNTKLGDHINYYDNGIAGNGVVSKMSGQFIQIFKEDGQFYNININDTFHVSDILINKTWDAMSLEEKTDELLKIKAYSPRFLNKTWDQLPRELKDVLQVKKETDQDANANANSRKLEQKRQEDAASSGEEITIGGSDDTYTPKPKRIPKKIKITKSEWDSMKSSSEDGAFGNTGSSPTTGVSTKIPFDATEDYEGTTHDILPEQFKYEDEKPEVGNEPKPEEVKLDGQGLIKTGEFVYSDRPNTYKIPAKEIGKGYGIKYGVKYINEEEDN